MPRRERSSAEWVTFAVSCLVLLTLIAVIVTQLGDRNGPAAPTATIDGAVEQVGDVFHVPVLVENRGGEPASSVQVQAELTIGEETSSADQTVDFLAVGGEESLVFVLDEDPATGELVVTVTGYATP